jgi:hypothetical protein
MIDLRNGFTVAFQLFLKKKIDSKVRRMAPPALDSILTCLLWILRNISVQ